MSQEGIEQIALEVCAINEERLAHDRASRKLKAEEDALRANLIKAMQDDGLQVIETAKVYVGVTQHQKPVILNWSELEVWIRENNAVDMLQKRLTESAVNLRWDEGVQIPGVGIQKTDKVTAKIRNTND